MFWNCSPENPEPKHAGCSGGYADKQHTPLPSATCKCACHNHPSRHTPSTSNTTNAKD